MFIENEHRNTLQAPLGAAYLEFDAWPGLCWWRSSPCRSSDLAPQVFRWTPPPPLAKLAV